MKNSFLKRVAIFFFLFFLLKNFYSFSQKNSADIERIKKVLAEQSIAWNNGNISDFMKGYWKSDSLKFISKKGISYGWEKTFQNYTKSYPNKEIMGILNFDLLSVEMVANDLSFVVGNWNLKREMGDVGGIFTLLLRQINGEWKIICDHTE